MLLRELRCGEIICERSNQCFFNTYNELRLEICRSAKLIKVQDWPVIKTARNSPCNPLVNNGLQGGLFPGLICPGLIEATIAWGYSS